MGKANRIKHSKDKAVPASYVPAPSVPVAPYVPAPSVAPSAPPAPSVAPSAPPAPPAPSVPPASSAPSAPALPTSYVCRLWDDPQFYCPDNDGSRPVGPPSHDLEVMAAYGVHATFTTRFPVYNGPAVEKWAASRNPDVVKPDDYQVLGGRLPLPAIP